MKSNVSDYLELVRRIYIDATARCTADVSDLRDLAYVKSRVKEEGLSFLTITLPRFCSDFESALKLGGINSTHFLGFRKYGSIPSFLRGMISLIFDQETGRIYDKAGCNSTDIPVLVACVRQICLTFKKLEVPCTPEREAEAVANFLHVEDSFGEFSLSEEDIQVFDLVSSMLWDNMLHDLRVSDAIPKHGPGATADRISGNGKYEIRRWHDRLEPYFPILDNGYVVSADYERVLEKIEFVSPDDELPVRVVLVPKTLKGPRVIAIEPLCMQFTQQGIRDMIYHVIESSVPTKGHVNFRDQSVNQGLALTSSRDGLLATIDLSDASDRVPRDLALRMFRSNPDLMDAIDACRSTKALLPNGTLIGPLKKFASMGSALCFPVESMYFYTICVAALLKEMDLPVTYRSVQKCASNVHIYGDDIIVPSMYAETVLDYLQKYNCKVNHNKTFFTGRFRESCGVDAYDGMDVTPTYIRQPHPKNRQQAKELVSWCATANLFYERGYWHTAQYMFSCIERVIGELPYVAWDSQLLGRKSYLGYVSIDRWNDKRKCFEVRAYAPEPVYRTDVLDDYDALSKSLLRLGTLKDSLEPRDPLHLKRSALHGVVAIKRRWVAS
jgi:hypothetical protein